MFGDGSLQQYSGFARRGQARRTPSWFGFVRLRNQALEAEVADLKSGLDAIEERARTELGMIDENETFYQFVKTARFCGIACVPMILLCFATIQLAPRQANGAVMNRESNDAEQIAQAPIDADGSAAGRPNGPDAEALIIPGSISAER